MITKNKRQKKHHRKYKNTSYFTRSMPLLLIIHLRTPKTNSSYVYKIPHKSLSIDKVCTRLSLLPTATTQYVYDWRSYDYSFGNLCPVKIHQRLMIGFNLNSEIRPYWYSWNLINAKTIAKHFFSNVGYLQSLFFSFRLKNDTVSFNPLRTSPIP